MDLKKKIRNLYDLRSCGVILFLFLLATMSQQGFAHESYKYKVISVLDGDTFIATDGNVSFKVRIAAMDAPEKGQPFSKMAKNRLEQILKSKNVMIKPVGKGHDRYGRVLGHVFFDGQDVAFLMIQEGLATYYRPFCRDYPEDKGKYNQGGKQQPVAVGKRRDSTIDMTPYIEAEKEARKMKKNMWSDEHTILPCKYRRLYK